MMRESISKIILIGAWYTHKVLGYVYKGSLNTCTKSRLINRLINGMIVLQEFLFFKRVILLSNPIMMLRPFRRDDVLNKIILNDWYLRISIIIHEQYLLISSLKNVLNILVMFSKASPRRSKFCNILKRTRICFLRQRRKWILFTLRILPF
jgi:hypothetical protein